MLGESTGRAAAASVVASLVLARASIVLAIGSHPAIAGYCRACGDDKDQATHQQHIWPLPPVLPALLGRHYRAVGSISVAERAGVQRLAQCIGHSFLTRHLVSPWFRNQTGCCGEAKRSSKVSDTTEQSHASDKE